MLKKVFDYIHNLRGKKSRMPRIDFFCHFRSRRQFKIFPKKILLENDLTHLFKKKFLKNIYNCRKTTLSKALNSSFSEFPCSLSFKGALRKYFTKSYFTQHSGVVIILFKWVHGGLRFLHILLKN